MSSRCSSRGRNGNVFDEFWRFRMISEKFFWKNKKHLLVKKFYCLFINFLSKNSLTSAKPGLSCHFGRADWITICTGQMCIAMAFMPWSCQFYNCLFWSELLLSAAAVKVWMLGNRKQINKCIISTLTQYTMDTRILAVLDCFGPQFSPFYINSSCCVTRKLALQWRLTEVNCVTDDLDGHKLLINNEYASKLPWLPCKNPQYILWHGFTFPFHRFHRANPE